MTHTAGGLPLVTDILFTLVVFVAVLAVLTETYAEVVLVATLFAVLWQVVAAFGPSLFLATVIILAVAGVRLALTLFGTAVGIDTRGTQLVAGVVDEILTGRDP